MTKPILLVDFSKVISGVWISHFLSAQRAQYCTIDASTIRTIYKKHIHWLVCGTISIHRVIDELTPFLSQWATQDNLLRCAKICPLISTKIQKLLGILSRTHRLVIVSDTYRELGPAIRKKLKKWNIQCFFSYEYGSKKSEKYLWQQIGKKIPIHDIVCFIDDKQENLDRAKDVGIPWLLFPDEEHGIDALLKHIYPHTDRCILWWWASGILYGYFLQKYTDQSFIIFEKEKKSGWLMQSFRLWQQRYDLWWHALHDANTKIKDFLSRETAVIHDRQKRQAYIWYDGVHIPFPFQLHLWYLSPEKKKRCLESFLHAYVTNKGKKHVLLMTIFVCNLAMKSIHNSSNHIISRYGKPHLIVSRPTEPKESVPKILIQYCLAISKQMMKIMGQIVLSIIHHNDDMKSIFVLLQMLFPHSSKQRQISLHVILNFIWLRPIMGWYTMMHVFLPFLFPNYWIWAIYNINQMTMNIYRSKSLQ